jgi:hypothetical protein
MDERMIERCRDQRDQSGPIRSITNGLMQQTDWRGRWRYAMCNISRNRIGNRDEAPSSAQLASH